jgi:hypothetical protein
MRGNAGNVQDTGTWVYLGNTTYDLISYSSGDRNHTYITLDESGKSFSSGTLYSSGSAVGQERVFKKE